MLIDFYNTGILTWKRTNYIQQIKHLHGLENWGGKLRAWLIPACCSIEELRGYTPHVGGFHLAACLSRNACAGWHGFIGLGNFRARKETSVRNMEGRNTKTCIQGHKRLVAWWSHNRSFCNQPCNDTVTLSQGTVFPWVLLSAFVNSDCGHVILFP